MRLPELDRWRVAPVLAAAAVAALYLILDLRTGDLAAHLYRADLFGREGFTIWNGNWYGGHHTPAYSVLFPPLAHYLTPQVAGAIAAVVAAALFEPLARVAVRREGEVGGAVVRRRGRRALCSRDGCRSCSAWPSGSARCSHCSAAASRSRPCSRSSARWRAPSPASSSRWPRSRTRLVARTRSGALLAGLAVAAPVLLSAAFPEGGFQPFTFRSFAAVPIFCALLFVLLPREHRTLRVGAVLYALAATAAYLIDTPMGNNAVRLAELFGGAIVVCFLPWRHELRLRRRLSLRCCSSRWPRGRSTRPSAT